MHIKSYVAILAFETQSNLATLARWADFARYLLSTSKTSLSDNPRDPAGATANARLQNTQRLDQLLAQIGPDDFCRWAAKQALNGARDADGFWMLARNSCEQSPHFPILAKALLEAFERGDTVRSLARRSSIFLSPEERSLAIHQLREAIEHRSRQALPRQADCCGECQSKAACLASAK